LAKAFGGFGAWQQGFLLRYSIVNAGSSSDCFWNKGDCDLTQQRNRCVGDFIVQKVVAGLIFKVAGIKLSMA